MRPRKRRTGAPAASPTAPWPGDTMLYEFYDAEASCPYCGAYMVVQVHEEPATRRTPPTMDVTIRRQSCACALDAADVQELDLDPLEY